MNSKNCEVAQMKRFFFLGGGRGEGTAVAVYLSFLKQFVLKCLTSQKGICVRGYLFFCLSRFILDASCGGVYEDGTGTITSPGYPNGYANNLDCMWLVYRTTETAEFIFTDFGTESSYDVVVITSGR